jgi:hypothetical protein
LDERALAKYHHGMFSRGGGEFMATRCVEATRGFV